jgi:hypothetical protein
VSAARAPRVTALVAARNERATVAVTVKALFQVPGVDEVVVVDDGSTDGTAAEANAAGARVLVSPRTIGKGGALEGALRRLARPAVWLLVDADTGSSALETVAVLEPVLAGRADLAIGRLPRQAGGGLGFVKQASAWIVRLACGYEPMEPLSGQRAATAEALDGCRPLAGGFGAEVGMTIDAVRLGLRVVEVPVDMRHRATGRGAAGFAHRGRQGLHILRAALPRLAGLR